MPRFAKKFNLETAQEKQVQNSVLKTLSQMKRDWLGQGRWPTGLLAACFYISLKEILKDLSYKQISEIFQVSEETVRKRVGEFKCTNNLSI